VNHATPGHKLQGKTLKSFLIADWSSLENWNYVVFFCVKTLRGLFLMKPILENIDFLPASNYLEMMENLRNMIIATPEQVLDLKAKLNC
jgi:hypothetical protein